MADSNRLDALIGGRGKVREDVRGRSSDPRQDPYYSDAAGFPEFGNPSWERWLLSFPEDRYPSSKQYKGSIPLAVVGHADMEAAEFADFVEMIHYSVFPKQVYPPAYLTDPPEDCMVDARRFVDGGDYEPPFRENCPESHEMLEQTADLADRLTYHPMSGPYLRQFLFSDGVYKLKPLYDRLLTIADEKLIRDKSDDMTLGDVLNNISHPFGTNSLY